MFTQEEYRHAVDGTKQKNAKHDTNQCMELVSKWYAYCLVVTEDVSLICMAKSSKSIGQGFRMISEALYSQCQNRDSLD